MITICHDQYSNSSQNGILSKHTIWNLREKNEKQIVTQEGDEDEQEANVTEIRGSSS